MSKERRPIEEGYFRLPKDGDRGALLGSYSPQANLYFFPRRRRCPVSEGPLENVELPAIGELYSWTYVYQSMMGTWKMGEQGGHGVGQIELPCGVRVQSIIKGAMGDWRIGMRMGLDFWVVRESGSLDEVTFCFTPLEGESA